MTTTETWHLAEVAGHRCELIEPPGECRGSILYLHGARLQSLSGQPGFAAEIARRQLRVAAPQGGRSWWTDKLLPQFDPQISAERYLVDRLIPDLAARWRVEPPAIALLGTGMGGQGALRLAFKHPRLFPVVAALSPAIDNQLEWDHDAALQAIYADPEAARQDTATLHVHPLNWPRNIFFACDPTNTCWFHSADKLRMKLAALGIPHQCDLETTVAAGHLAYYHQQLPKAIAFIVERLAAESRRV